MCLVVLGWQQHREFPLIVAGNRDEFHGRPTESGHWWPDRPDIVGGRDLQAGGTWLALHRRGRFATVTNFRDAQPPSPKYRSRGHLVTEFLGSTATPIDFLNDIDGAKYAGFNLLVSDGKTLAWLSNRANGVRRLAPGIYGLSNALLDSPWHKVIRSKAALEALIRDDKVNETELFRLLDDRQKAPVDEIKKEHLPFETAHAISAAFIVLPDYGTRSSSVALLDTAGSWRLHERRFDAAGNRTGDSAFTIAPKSRPDQL
jgi:uncharacterized protein with NRDE domain